MDRNLRILINVSAALCFVFCVAQAMAKEEWLCTQESSEIQDSSVLACGVGEGKDENQARSVAFENAKAEFSRLCKTSDTCDRRQVTVEPRRTSCEETKNVYKCYRLIVFTLGAERLKKPNSTASLKDTPEAFVPFTYESISTLPKLSKGMSKKEMLAAFGAPDSIESLSSGALMIFYRGKMCLYDSCHVIVGDDKVRSWEHFKPVYTEDLK